MGKKGLKKFGKKFGKIAMSILLSIFCTFSFAGCISLGPNSSSSGGGGGGSSSGGGGGSSSGGGGGSTSGGGGSSWWEDFGGDLGPDYDINDLLAGVIGVYDIDGTEQIFYDKYVDDCVSYEYLANRQFDTLATYIYSTLNRIYGTDSSESFTISGYGNNISVPYTATLKNEEQLAAANIGSGTSKYLNYEDAIHGGKSLTIEYDESANNGNGDFVYTYSTVSGDVISANAWKNATWFTSNGSSGLKNALVYIYKNQQNVNVGESQLLQYNLISSTNLKSYYSNFNINNIGSNNVVDLSSIELTREYMWNVLYFLAYTIIGESNINRSIAIFESINVENVIIGMGTVAIDYAELGEEGTWWTSLPDTSEDPSVTTKAKFISLYADYKGYNTVLDEIIYNCVNLRKNNNSPLADNVNYFNSTSLDLNFLFVKSKKEAYIYYDDVNKINESLGSNFDDEEYDEEDYEYDFDNDDYEDYEESPILCGPSRRIKQLILVPYINKDKCEIDKFELDMLLLGMASGDNEEYTVAVSYDYINKDGASNTKSVYFQNDSSDGGIYASNGRLICGSDTNTFDYMVEVEFNNCVLYNSKLMDGTTDAKTLIESSFAMKEEEVTYEDGTVKKFTRGYLKVYNELLNNGSLQLKNNYVKINFEYFKANIKQTTIPLTCFSIFMIDA